VQSHHKKSINVPRQEGVTLEQVATEYMLDPKTLGAMVVDGNVSSVSNQVDVEFARDVIGHGIEEIKKGDLSKLEEMLYSQAVALNMMFANLSRKASIQTNVDVRSAIVSLALKSQNQSRNTIQTLINLKQPNQTAFIKQQTNVASGHQQINNGVIPSSPEKLLNEPIELLEMMHGKRLDRGTKATAKRVDTEMEALGAINRGKNPSRKSKVK
jgi:hypothetical protein